MNAEDHQCSFLFSILWVCGGIVVWYSFVFIIGRKPGQSDASIATVRDLTLTISPRWEFLKILDPLLLCI